MYCHPQYKGGQRDVHCLVGTHFLNLEKLTNYVKVVDDMLLLAGQRGKWYSPYCS
jgi:hypothetical protein